MNKSIFICPKCGKQFIRDLHYNTIVGMQNLISISSDGDGIEDMCMCCNYVVVKENKEDNYKENNYNRNDEII